MRKKYIVLISKSVVPKIQDGGETITNEPERALSCFDNFISFRLTTMDMKSKRQNHRQTGSLKKTEPQKDGQSKRQNNRQTGSLRDRTTDRRAVLETELQTNR